MRFWSAGARPAADPREAIATLLLAAREDPLAAMREEGDLPPDLELSDEAIDDAGTRARLRRRRCRQLR
jgi:hypothetical protein